MGKSRHFWKYMPNSKFLFIEQYNTQGVTVTVAPFPIPPEPQGSILCGLRCQPNGILIGKSVA